MVRLIASLVLMVACLVPAAAQTVVAPAPLNFSFETPPGFVPDLDIPRPTVDSCTRIGPLRGEMGSAPTSPD